MWPCLWPELCVDIATILDIVASLMSTKPRKPILRVVLPNEVVDALQKLADERLWTMSATIRNLVVAGLSADGRLNKPTTEGQEE